MMDSLNYQAEEERSQRRGEIETVAFHSLLRKPRGSAEGGNRMVLLVGKDSQGNQVATGMHVLKEISKIRPSQKTKRENLK